jgi:uncharacterized protein YgiM (DUF1202 family)
MKKIAICVVLMLCLGAGSLFAQDVLSFPSPITPVHPIINAGVGFGSGWGYLGGSMGIPPILASVDFPVDVGVPLSFGGGVGFTSVANILNVLSIVGRAALHLNFGVPGLDVYPVLSLGYNLYFWDASWFGGYLGGGGGAFAFGIAGGVRYFFNDNIGIWAELGYSQLTVIAGGVTFTFGGNKGSTSSSSSSRSGRYMLVNTDTLNVRSGPSADNSIVGTLARNTRVEVLNRTGTWWEIRSGNIRGYVNSSLLREEN